MNAQTTKLTASRARALVAGALLFIGATYPAIGEDPISTVDYTCKDNKTVKATYFSDKVDLVLGDGRTMTLPQTMSGSGIRYANADESFVFWSKGDGAFVTEGDPDKPTFADCVGKKVS